MFMEIQANNYIFTSKLSLFQSLGYWQFENSVLWLQVALPYFKSKLESAYNAQRGAMLQAALWGRGDADIFEADFIAEQAETTNLITEVQHQQDSRSRRILKKMKTFLAGCYPWIHAANEERWFRSILGLLLRISTYVEYTFLRWSLRIILLLLQSMIKHALHLKPPDCILSSLCNIERIPTLLLRGKCSAVLSADLALISHQTILEQLTTALQSMYFASRPDPDELPLDPILSFPPQTSLVHGDLICNVSKDDLFHLFKCVHYLLQVLDSGMT
eukprot:Gb_06721 [translate_table: standard]